MLCTQAAGARAAALEALEDEAAEARWHCTAPCLLWHSLRPASDALHEHVFRPLLL
eukprot:COSAG01_NODE_34053_length_554_cov_1.226374_2_plen_55_part_01